jgi:hypothetical protein
MKALRSSELLSLPVRLGGVTLGHPVDLLVDLGATRVLGFEVRRHDHVRRFLPLAAAKVGAAEIAIDSPLILLDELAFYRKRGTGLSALRGSRVDRHGAFAGVLRDIVFAADGTVESIVVEGPGGERRLPAGADVRLERRAPAA